MQCGSMKRPLRPTAPMRSASPSVARPRSAWPRITLSIKGRQVFRDRLRVDAVEARVHLTPNLADVDPGAGQQIVQVAPARAVHGIHHHPQAGAANGVEVDQVAQVRAIRREGVEAGEDTLG